jgi:hypothetical protein
MRILEAASTGTNMLKQKREAKRMLVLVSAAGNIRVWQGAQSCTNIGWTFPRMAPRGRCQRARDFPGT